MNKKIKIAFASMLAVPLLACAQVRTEQTERSHFSGWTERGDGACRTYRGTSFCRCGMV